MNALPLHNSLKALKGRERGLRVTGLMRKLTACLIVSCVEKKRMKRGKNSEKKCQLRVNLKVFLVIIFSFMPFYPVIILIQLVIRLHIFLICSLL